MTTPERFRRRQRIEEGILICLAGLMVLQTAYFHAQDNRQQHCFENKISELSEALKVRGELSDRDSKNTSTMILAVSSAKTPQEYKRILARYKVVYNQIEQDRKENPVPPYPPGTCNVR